MPVSLFGMLSGWRNGHPHLTFRADFFLPVTHNQNGRAAMSASADVFGTSQKCQLLKR
jgi:hypothetical protein